MISATLPKGERLSGKTSISKLMSSGRWGGTAHLKYCFAPAEDDSPSRIAVSVPKKLFKRAVKRNLLKRRVRESYRTSKGLLGSDRFDILFVWNSTEIQESGIILAEIRSILTAIAAK